MIQHLLLMTLAPPFLWLGLPVKPLAHALPHRFVAFLAPISRWAPMKRLGKILANPTLCWLAASAALIGWHIPSLFALGLQSEMWHGIEQASFLTSGILFWWPVVRPRPTVSNWSEWSILLYLFLATLAMRHPFRISCLLRPRSLPGLLSRHRTGLHFLLLKTSSVPVP